MSIKYIVGWYTENIIYATKNLMYMIRDSIKMNQLQYTLKKSNSSDYKNKYCVYLDYEKHFKIWKIQRYIKLSSQYIINAETALNYDFVI